MKTRRLFVLADQYGQVVLRKAVSPRRAVIEETGCAHPEKMYIDEADGESRHVGYVAKGRWIGTYLCEPCVK